jgi:hypothetical protein
VHGNRLSACWRQNSTAAGSVRYGLVEKRRRYNRLYMRGWRADSAHSARERANRERWHYERKLRNALRVSASNTENRSIPTCGFCRKNRPITRVWRLEIRDLAPRGYVEIRVPYCGEC